MAARGESATDMMQLDAAPEEGQPPRTSNKIAARGRGAADQTSMCGVDTLSSYKPRRRRARRAERHTYAGGGGGGGLGRGAAEALAVAPAAGRGASDAAPPAEDWAAFERLVARQQEHHGLALEELSSSGKKVQHWAW